MKMSRQQTLPFTEDTSTCSQAGSPASRSASQASAKALTITATYGQRCCERFERLSHVGSWAKTFTALLIGRAEWYSSRCNLIWKMLGTKCNRILFRLAPSMRPIAETECGLLPTVGMLKTPSAMDANKSLATAKKNPTSGNSGCLAQEIANGYAAKMRGLSGTSQNSQLNPLFVAEMMGFPTDWTLVPFLDGLRSTNDGDSAAGGAKSQSKPTATP